MWDDEHPKKQIKKMESESDIVVTYAPEFECQLFQCY